MTRAIESVETPRPKAGGAGGLTRLKNWLRSAVYPGLDLHTRNRASLCRFWKSGPRAVLDAGSGNGYFSWLAYRSGARVLALNINAEQVAKAREFLVEFKSADGKRLRFLHFNLYDLPSLKEKFDEIICYETLEHIRRDDEIVREFYRLLNPGGVLHLCCPYSLHPRHKTSELDVDETGGHVRAGYTREDYAALLTPVGFQLDVFAGIGSPALCRADDFLRLIRHKLGDMFALPLLPVLLPVVWWSRFDPRIPFSLYVRARKPAVSGLAQPADS
jgi:SAM-dependent methyltransferase